MIKFFSRESSLVVHLDLFLCCFRVEILVLPRHGFCRYSCSLKILNAIPQVSRTSQAVAIIGTTFSHDVVQGPCIPKGKVDLLTDQHLYLKQRCSASVALAQGELYTMSSSNPPFFVREPNYPPPYPVVHKPDQGTLRPQKQQTLEAHINSSSRNVVKRITSTKDRSNLASRLPRLLLSS